MLIETSGTSSSGLAYSSRFVDSLWCMGRTVEIYPAIVKRPRKSSLVLLLHQLHQQMPMKGVSCAFFQSAIVGIGLFESHVGLRVVEMNVAVNMRIKWIDLCSKA